MDVLDASLRAVLSAANRALADRALPGLALDDETSPASRSDA